MKCASIMTAGDSREDLHSESTGSWAAKRHPGPLACPCPTPRPSYLKCTALGEMDTVNGICLAHNSESLWSASDPSPTKHSAARREAQARVPRSLPKKASAIGEGSVWKPGAFNERKAVLGSRPEQDWKLIQQMPACGSYLQFKGGTQGTENGKETQ